jgi:predicted MFS family arabinose efflux permease
MDRSLPILLVEPMREAFKLSDTQLGMVTGLSYGIAYGIGGLIVGPLLDRFNRVRMLSAMVFGWSALTAMCGLATSYAMLVAARIGVGAAESGGTPASYSIVADTFPKDRRATAIGLLKAGSPLGIFAASVVASVIAVNYGWQMAFLVAGIPGILLAIIALFVIPGGIGKLPPSNHPPYNFRAALDFMGRSPGVSWLMVGIIIYMLASAGAGGFQMSLFQRVHGLSLKEMSWFYGAAHALSALGPIGAALICDRLARRNVRLPLMLLATISLVAMILGTAMSLSDNVNVALGMMIAWQIVAASLSAPAFATLLTLTPPQMRGTVTGTLSAGMYLFGIGPAPVIAGSVSDALGGGDMVRYAIVVMSMTYIIALACFAACYHKLKGHDKPAL